MTTYSLKDKAVLITGAASGIGAACARKAHAEGAKVILVDISEAGCKALAEELGHERTLAVSASVTDQQRLDYVAQLAVETFGGIDVVFANAGIACDPPTTIRAMKAEMFQAIIDVNLLGIWRTVMACLPQIIVRQGHVLVTASAYAYVNGVANAPYAMSKAGVEMFGRALRAELAGTGATVGVLYPGWVKTPIANVAFGGHKAATELVEMGFPGFLRKPIAPERVAAAVVRGVQSRAPRIMAPARWITLSLLRGIVNVFSDQMLDRRQAIQSKVREIEIETIGKAP